MSALTFTIRFVSGRLYSTYATRREAFHELVRLQSIGGRVYMRKS